MVELMTSLQPLSSLRFSDSYGNLTCSLNNSTKYKHEFEADRLELHSRNFHAKYNSETHSLLLGCYRSHFTVSSCRLRRYHIMLSSLHMVRLINLELGEMGT